MILSILLSLIFFTLGLIHLNWVLGGKFGFEKSLPTNEEGKRVLNPKKIDTIIIALGLISFGIFYIFKSTIVEYNLPVWIMKHGSWIIHSIFILRALGDFKYIGFFKKINTTEFGKMDSKFYSPLCLIIGISGLLIFKMNF